MASATPWDSVLDQIVNALAERLGNKLAAKSSHYSNASLPEGTSVETFNRRCRALEKLGRASKTGKVWRVAVADYHEPALPKPSPEDSDRELLQRAAKRGSR
jgi:hypothetical protein